MALLRLRAVLFFCACAFLLVYSNLFYQYYINKLFTDFGGGYVSFNVKDAFGMSFIFDNLLFVLDSKFYLLRKDFLSVFAFIAFFLILNLFIKRALWDKLFLLAGFPVIGMLCFHYFSTISALSFTASFCLAALILFVYLCDFVLLRNNTLPQNQPFKKFLYVFFSFTPGFAEIFCTPLYFSLIGRGCNQSRKYLAGCLHFSVIVFLILILTTPLNKQNIKESTCLTPAECYGLAISENTSRLFVYNVFEKQIDYIDLAVGGGRCEVFYPLEFQISEFITVNDYRKELYLINRTDQELLALDVNGNQVKSLGFFHGFDCGVNSRMASDENDLFIINDEPYYIYKIDLSGKKTSLQNEMKTNNCFLVYNKKRKVLYANEWVMNRKLFQFFVYEIDADNLRISRKIPVRGPSRGLAVSEDGQRLYCALPFEYFLSSYVYVFDTGSLDIIKKIRVPFGTRAIALDEERQILFAVSAFTNLIELISLKNEKVMAVYKAGDFSARHIVLDKKRRHFYLSTQCFGLFRGSYSHLK